MMPTFSHPQFLAPTAGIVGLALLLGLWAQLRPGLGVRVVGQRPWLLALGLAVLAGGAGLGLAEPRWGLPEVPRLTVHVVIDASRSMQAADASGTPRWNAALKALDRLWAQPQPGLRYGVDLLTGDVIPLMPPGDDRTLLKDALRVVQPGDFGSPGTSLGRGLGQVLAQVPASEPAVILLLGDGEETWQSEVDAERDAVAALQAAKIPLYAMAFGGEAPVPLPPAEGRTEALSTRARPDFLRKVAEGSGGRLLQPDADLRAVLADLAAGKTPLPVGRSKQPAHPEWGAWVALLGLAGWMAAAGRPLGRWRVDL